MSLQNISDMHQPREQFSGSRSARRAPRVLSRSESCPRLLHVHQCFATPDVESDLTCGVHQGHAVVNVPLDASKAERVVAVQWSPSQQACQLMTATSLGHVYLWGQGTSDPHQECPASVDQWSWQATFRFGIPDPGTRLEARLPSHPPPPPSPTRSSAPSSRGSGNKALETSG